MASRRTVIAGAAAAGVAGTIGYVATRPSHTDAVARVWSLPAPGAVPDTEFLLRHATVAANSHNTQPWLFRPREGGIDILPDRARTTPVVDPDDHHLFASLGCAAENLALAAGALGLAAAVALEGDTLRIDLAPGGTLDPLFAAIPQRQSTRSDYDGSPVSPEDIAMLQVAAKMPGTEILLVTDPPRLAAITDLLARGAGQQAADPAFTAELRQWLRFSAARAIETGDGLFSACSGNPVVPEWLGALLFGQFFTETAEVEKLRRQIASSAGLAVIVSNRNDAGHWMAAGRASQRFGLQATALGLRYAYVNQTVEVPALRQELAALLALGDRRPSLVLRFGRAAAMTQSLRRPLAKVMAV